jgi:MFS family permease
MAPALKSRNFRIFWFGQLLSVTGTSLQVVAEGYLIYQLTGSTFWLGMVGLLALIPVLPISLLGGVLIDRVPRRKLIMVTQSALLVQALLFGLLAISGRLQLWHIILLYFIFGAILAIDHPARRAFLVELVDEKDLANAVALNATIFNFSSLIGYALAGIMIAVVGAGMTMLLNSLTYLAPIIAMSFIRVADVSADPRSKGATGKPFHEAVLEGARVLWQQPSIIGTISLMAIVGGLAWPVFGMMPAYAEEVMHTGAMGLGTLMAMGALGSILGTILVARLGGQRRGHTLTIAAIVLSILVTCFAFTRNMLPAALLLIGIGAALLIVQSLAITLVQVNIPDRVRGRVMTIYSILHAGSDTVGNVAVGSLAVYVGLPISLGLAGLAALFYALGLRAVLPDVDKLD